MCEEVRNPVQEVPRALAWSIPIGFLTGLLFLLPVVFTLPDINMLLAGETTCDDRTSEMLIIYMEVPGGQPIGVLFTSIMGSRGGGFGMVITRIRMLINLTASLMIHAILIDSGLSVRTSTPLAQA